MVGVADRLAPVYGRAGLHFPLPALKYANVGVTASFRQVMKRRRSCMARSRHHQLEITLSIVVLPAKLRALTCISHHMTAKARDKKAVIRVSCLVFRKNHGREPGSLQKEMSDGR